MLRRHHKNNAICADEGKDLTGFLLDTCGLADLAGATSVMYSAAAGPNGGVHLTTTKYSDNACAQSLATTTHAYASCVDSKVHAKHESFAVSCSNFVLEVFNSNTGIAFFWN